jgi:transcriptional regulator with XRE-family HTH domain
MFLYRSGDTRYENHAMAKSRGGGGYTLDKDASAKVAKRVSARMSELGLSQNRLAKESGVPQGKISELLSGGLNFTKNHILAISRAIGLSERELVPEDVMPGGGEQAAPEPVVQGVVEFLARNAARLKIIPSEAARLTALRFRSEEGLEKTDAFWEKMLQIIREHPLPATKKH